MFSLARFWQWNSTHRVRFGLGAGLLLLALLAAPGHASETLHPLSPPDTSSPRATLTSLTSGLEMIFEDRGRARSADDKTILVQRVVRCLDLSDQPREFVSDTGLESALMLKEVLDRIEMPAMDDVPGSDDVRPLPLDASAPASTGNRARSMERWTVPNTEIVISRVSEGPRRGEFLFSRDTVARLPEFYRRVAHLPYREGATTPGMLDVYRTSPGQRYRLALNQVLPDWSRHTVAGQALWQWASTALLLVVMAVGISTLLTRAYRMDMAGAERPRDEDGDGPRMRLFTAAALALSAGWISATRWAQDSAINMTGTTLKLLGYTLIALEAIALCWLAFLLIAQLGEWFVQSRGYQSKGARGQLVRLLARIAGATAVVFIVIYTADRVGLPAYSVVTGLGVGGLALALGAQETLRDLFASVTIMSDRPFSVGDWVIVGEHEGVVEAIGYRSTRIRCFTNSVVSVPNSEMTSMPIDNMGRRHKRRVRTTIGIREDTSRAKIEAFLEGSKAIILAHPQTEKDNCHVVFRDFGEACLDILLYFYLEVSDWGTELQARQAVFLDIIALAERLGVEFAPDQEVEVFPGRPHPGADVEHSDEELKDIVAGIDDIGKAKR